MRKKLILLAVSMFLTLAMASAATFAWIKTGIDIDSTTSKVNASTSANIIIFADSNSINLNDPNTLTLAMPDAHTISKFNPATHDDSSASKLKYVHDANEISGTTGLKDGEGEITFENVLESDNSRFYVDYVFYLAAYGKRINNGELSAWLTNTQDRTSYLGAASIDFYVNNTYKDTLNLAGYDITENDYTTEKTVVSLGTYNFPYYNSSSAIKITLRCYFDGGLLRESGYTFITKEVIKNITLSPIDLNVHFLVEGGTEVN